ncbi:MAG: GerMN domain-containing protein [Clostridiales bacterium]|nr:GerMN domain-containing protein [Clostridiales bacterium]
MYLRNCPRHSIFQKYKLAILFFLCLCILQSSVLASQFISPASMLDAKLQEDQPSNISVPLYFRYKNTAYLAREMRDINIARTMTVHLALINALLSGPGSLSPQLSPLFPSGTQALSVVAEDETLFITFNDKILSRYSDEALIFNAEYSQGEGKIRRQLAMASIINTITENSPFTKVQVLVRQENYVSTSMRLSARYYLLDEDSLPPPLTRQEEYILTPQVSARIFLEGWQNREFTSSLRIVRSSTDQSTSDLPTEFDLRQSFEQAPLLEEFNITPGVVSIDGQSAVLSISLKILTDEGEERFIQNRPLHLVMREGIFTIPLETFEQLLRIVK